MLRILLFCLAIGLIDYYNFQLVKSLHQSKTIHFGYVLFSLLVIGLTIFKYTIGRQYGSVQVSNLITGIFIVVYITKLFIGLVYFGDDILRLTKASWNYFTKPNVEGKTFDLPSRRKFVKLLALGLASIPFSSLLYGIFQGKYNFKVLKYTLYFDDLPSSFDGYQITQISDIHSGSFDNKEKIEYAIDLINEQKSDVLMFTGDMVNLVASEMDPWKPMFSKLSAKDGIYSVLGNHDYGDYVKWESKSEKVKNLEELKTIQKDMGFDLLLNENRFIERGKERISIVGVENWGRGFKQMGDLHKASVNLKQDDFKIVLSHDPTHWEDKISRTEIPYQLTLSGHTHGMQMGIEIPGWIKWSPIKWRYKYWAGIYKENGRILNVNRGFGFLAFPGRIGIWPEITVITLRKGKDPKTIQKQL